MSNYKGALNRPSTSATNSSVFQVHSPFNDAGLVKVVNDFEDDLLTGRMNGRGTGFTGGYSNDISLTPTAVLPPYSGWNGWVPLPDATTGTGAANVYMASSSTQDASGGTGCYVYIVIFQNLQKQVMMEFVEITGTTPKLLNAKNIYHFMYAFPVGQAGSAYNRLTNAITSNIGTIWCGIGTFSTTTGFTTNYMWNRPGDGFLSSTVYVVPAGKYGSLWSVKLNSDTGTACLFRTYSRGSRNDSWSLNAEDNVNTGMVIRRSLAGGFLPAGAEFTVIANKTANVNNISGNFVMCCYEFSARCFSQGNADF